MASMMKICEKDTAKENNNKKKHRATTMTKNLNVQSVRGGYIHTK